MRPYLKGIDLRNYLADSLNASVLLTSRGTTALFIALNYIKRTRGHGEVVMPATSCPAIPLAAIFNGLKPVFSDVENGKFVTSEEQLLKHINENTVAVVVPHLFGKIIDLPTLRKNSNIVVVDDIAQTSLNASPFLFDGTEFAFVVMSFDDRKTIRGKGGALIVGNNIDPEELTSINKELPMRDGAFEHSENNSLLACFETSRRSNLSQVNYFNDSKVALWESFLIKYDDELSVTADIQNSQTTTKSRYNKYLCYLENLPEALVDTAETYSKDECIWRLPCLLPESLPLETTVNTLRRSGFICSNHYFTMARVFEGSECKNADRVTLGGINFFVDDFISFKEIKGLCGMLSNLHKQGEDLI